MLCPEKERLLRFFNKDPGCLSIASFRRPAGSFCRQEFSDLNELNLVEFDTRTGIACQGPDEWDAILTKEGQASIIKKP